MDVAPNRATVQRGNQMIELDVEDIVIDDRMIVKPGEKLAMDGIVMQGTSSINQAAITGESMPVQKTPGEEVFAGTINEEGSLEIQVTKRVEEDRKRTRLNSSHVA